MKKNRKSSEPVSADAIARMADQGKERAGALPAFGPPTARSVLSRWIADMFAQLRTPPWKLRAHTPTMEGPYALCNTKPPFLCRGFANVIKP
jgi:hypothetical protein